MQGWKLVTQAPPPPDRALVLNLLGGSWDPAVQPCFIAKLRVPKFHRLASTLARLRNNLARRYSLLAPFGWQVYKILGCSLIVSSCQHESTNEE